MDDTRWRQIDKLFEHALEVEEGHREAFLKTRCGDDLKLRRSVERLLALEIPTPRSRQLERRITQEIVDVRHGAVG